MAARVSDKAQRRSDPLPLPRQHNRDPVDPATGNHHRRLTNVQDTWRARYAETHTPGSEGGPGKRTGGNTSTAPGAYLTRAWAGRLRTGCRRAEPDHGLRQVLGVAAAVEILRLPSGRPCRAGHETTTRPGPRPAGDVRGAAAGHPPALATGPRARP